jgi:phosphatidylserine decarboxylase
MMKTLLWLLPKRTLTAMVGRYARSPSSRTFIPWYIRHYQIDVSEADRELAQYRCLAEFFCRSLRRDARPICSHGIVSPVDGTVSEFGQVEAGQLLQAKGCTYSLAALLGDSADAAPYLDGSYLTLYLSPRDYHRIHAPLSGTVRRWRFIPGRLYPVNRYGVSHISGLFSQNERMVSWLDTAFGTVAVVKVGATIVGSIQTPYGPPPAGPFHMNRRQVSEKANGIEVNRGEEIGHFVFGSTVILVFPPDVVERFTVKRGDTVRMGQLVAELTARRDGDA